MFIVSDIAQLIGATDAALILLFSLLAGYPLAFIYRKFIYGKYNNPNFHHFYFAITGLILAYLNFGSSCIHSFICILFTYIVILWCGGTTLSVILSFAFQLTYLCVGYYVTAMDKNYAITWTTPHCVLTLKLIGLTWDLYDGKCKTQNFDSAVSTSPSFSALLGYIYFFGGFLVGPQFTYVRYNKLITGQFNDPVTKSMPNSTRAAFMRLLSGIGYIIIFQITSAFLPDDYLLKENFAQFSMLKKFVLITIWGKFVLYKYVGCWLVTEGSCILSGLTYNEKNEKGQYLWDACSNIKIRKFESLSTTQHLVESFNRNTNLWIAKYVFKRLKFLNNKSMSHFISLTFLAVWHGLHTGYFTTFAFEFIMVVFEKDIIEIGKNIPALTTSIEKSILMRSLIFLIGKLYVQFGLSYALVSFVLFSYTDWINVYLQVWFIPHIFLFIWQFIRQPIRRKFIPRPTRKPLGSESNQNDIKND